MKALGKYSKNATKYNKLQIKSIKFQQIFHLHQNLLDNFSRPKLD